jgi:hypothetical protein
MMKSFLSFLLPLGFGLRLRSQGTSDFGCSDSSDSSCIKPDPVPEPTPLNPASIITSTDENGYLTATSQDGDFPDVGDAVQGLDDMKDLADSFKIGSVKLSAPEPPALPITCIIEECTTTPNPDLQSTTSSQSSR